MSTTQTPNMLLNLPVPGAEDGPAWAQDLNTALTVLDSHDHSSNSGVKITPSGLDIIADLPLQGNNLTGVRTLRLASQLTPVAGPSDFGCLQEVGEDLYFVNGVGTNIRLTQSGSIVGAPGNITGLTAPASAVFDALSSTFIWQSDIDTPANMDGASVILRNLSANSKGLTLAPPNAMGADITITLPTPPSQESYTIMSSGGVISTLPRGIVYNAGTSGATKTIDWDNSPSQQLSVTADCTLTLTHPVNGESYMLILTQSGGSWTITWPAEVKWPNGVVMFSSASGQVDVVNLFWTGSIYLAVFGSNFS